MVRGQIAVPVFARVCAVALAALVSACAAAGPPRAPARAPTAVQASHSSIDAGAARAPRLAGAGGEFNSPDAVAVQGARVWVANGGGNSVTEINANTGALIRIISASRYQLNEPQAIAATGATVWVLGSNDVSNTAVTEIDAATGALVRVLEGSRYQFTGTGAIAASGNAVWVANQDSVTEIDAATGALVRVLQGSRYQFNELQEIAISGNTVWTAASPPSNNGLMTAAVSTAAFTTTEINAVTGALIRTGSATLPQYAFGMAADRFGAWLLTNDIAGKAGGQPDGEVAEFGAATGAPIRILSPPIVKNMPGNGAGIAVDDDHIWVTGTDYLAEFSAATGALIREITSSGP